MKIKFRNAHFFSVLATDLARLTYLEYLVNDYTDFYIRVLKQDVMRMTTSDWLKIIFSALEFILLPAISYLDLKRIRKFSEKSIGDSGEYITISHFDLYWRSFEDFDSKPQRYNT